MGSFAVANILVAYRHGLSVFELVDLRWVQVEFRMPSGAPFVHSTNALVGLLDEGGLRPSAQLRPKPLHVNANPRIVLPGWTPGESLIKARGMRATVSPSKTTLRKLHSAGEETSCVLIEVYPHERVRRHVEVGFTLAQSVVADQPTDHVYEAVCQRPIHAP